MSDRHQTTPYPLRMPEDLRAQLKQAAADSSRSMNAEIVARLQESFEHATASEPGDSLKELQRKLEAQDEVLTEAMRMLRNISLQSARSSSEKGATDDTDS